jgi:hypothetical protein
MPSQPCRGAVGTGINLITTQVSHETAGALNVRRKRECPERLDGCQFDDCMGRDTETVAALTTGWQSSMSSSHSSGASSVRRKLPVLGSVSQQAVNRLCLEPSTPRQAFSGAGRRRTSAIATGLREQHLEDRVDQCGLADTGAFGDHQQFRASATRTASIWLSASASFVRFSTKGLPCRLIDEVRFAQDSPLEEPVMSAQNIAQVFDLIGAGRET